MPGKPGTIVGGAPVEADGVADAAAVVVVAVAVVVVVGFAVGVTRGCVVVATAAVVVAGAAGVPAGAVAGCWVVSAAIVVTGGGAVVVGSLLSLELLLHPASPITTELTETTKKMPRFMSSWYHAKRQFHRRNSRPTFTSPACACDA